MRRKNHDEVDVINFDNLVRPSEDVIGETKPVRAKMPKFTAENAPATAQKAHNYTEVAEIASQAGMKFRTAFFNT